MGIAKIQNQIKSLESEKKKDYEAIVDTYIALAMAIREAEDWLKAEEAAETAIKIAKKLKINLLGISSTPRRMRQLGAFMKLLKNIRKQLNFWMNL